MLSLAILLNQLMRHDFERCLQYLLAVTGGMSPMINGPSRGDRDQRRQPEQVADGEAECAPVKTGKES